MGKQLVIAEKPSVAQDIANGLREDMSRKNGFYEGSKSIITWAVGHLIELADPEAYGDKYKAWKLESLPIVPEKFMYGVSNAVKSQYNLIKSLLERQDVDRVVIATDCGREGELIARLILRQAKCTKPTLRFWTSKALTPAAVEEGFSSLRPGSDFDRLDNAAVARQQADWLVGMNFTRLYTVKMGGYKNVYSIGRVQTPTLKLIVDRYLENTNFKPVDYWVVNAVFQHAKGSYQGQWINRADLAEIEKSKDGKASATEDGAAESDYPYRIPAEHRAEEIKKLILGQKGKILECTRKDGKEAPPLLFSLTTLQQEANKMHGFPMDKTLSLAQSLYEQRKALSYPRTESQYLNDEMATEIPRIIDNLASCSGVSFDRSHCTVSASNKRVFDTSRLTDHHALIPTGDIIGNMTDDEKKIYELVVRRFIAAFYPTYKFKTTDVLTEVAGECFLTRGKVVIDVGWRAIYGRTSKQTSLPALSKSDPVVVEEASVGKKQTTPLPLYTDATLLAAMTNAQRFVTDPSLKKILKETAGLGTSATRAAIVNTLITRQYILRQGKSLVPTEKGIFLIREIGQEQIADPAYTALWEQRLDAIASGEESSSGGFMTAEKEYTSGIIESVKGNKALALEKPGSADRSHQGSAPADAKYVGKCPVCGQPVRELPKSFSCTSGREKCSFVLWKDCLKFFGAKDLTAAQVKKLLQGKLIPLRDLESRKGKKYDSSGQLYKL
ncbi:MAG: DNA topoisomerase 3 [Syntrophus sp. SKADARSKE-3]|nr:DNA topoisomerase 3 [Syntrophus sp. SKADARSKE-3]